MADARQSAAASGQAATGGCGAPAGGVAITDAGSQAIVQGTVTKGGAPVQVGYARLLNSGGDFVAEVPLGTDGGFRFFAAPGDWTLRVLAPGGIRTDRAVTAATGEVRELQVAI
jgi:Protein of unknown function (DUF1416)